MCGGNGELFIDFAPGVFESYGAVEDHLFLRRVFVNVEVTDALELEVGQRLHALDELFDVAMGQDV